MTTGTSTRTEPDTSTVSALDFRTVCGSFVTGVTVVTARSANGVHGSTVNSFTSLSASPAQIIVCLAKSSATLAHVRASGHFAVNILAAEQTDVARVFASKVEDKLSTVDWSTGRNGAPIIDGSASSLECDVIDVQEQATHMLVIGRVTGMQHNPTAAPLVFYRSTLSAGDVLQGQLT